MSALENMIFCERHCIREYYRKLSEFRKKNDAQGIRIYEKLITEATNALREFEAAKKALAAQRAREGGAA